MFSSPRMLGRHVHHDPRSRDFPAPRAATQQTVIHTVYGRPLNQKKLGACTGNALAGALNTVPGAQQQGSRLRVEKDARGLYSLATSLDNVPGQWPPTDTGSTGLAVCKAGVQLGLLTGYQHAFGLAHMIDALQARAVIVGTNWYEGMFTPDGLGFVAPAGATDQVAGGHEWLVFGVDVDQAQFWAMQSWGTRWGVAPPFPTVGRPYRGFFRVRFEVMDRLLQEQGDVTVPVPRLAA